MSQNFAVFLFFKKKSRQIIMGEKKNSKVLKKNSKKLKKIQVKEDCHANCVQASESELRIDYDALLLDIEGDPLEEFASESEIKVGQMHFWNARKK